MKLPAREKLLVSRQKTVDYLLSPIQPRKKYIIDSKERAVAFGDVMK